MNQPEMKYLCGTGAVATRTNPVEVHYGLSRRTISWFCIAWDGYFRPTPLLTLDVFLLCIFFFFVVVVWKVFLQYNVLSANACRCA